MLAPVLKQHKRTISISANRRGPTYDGGDVIIEHRLQDLNSVLAHGVGDSLEFENDFAFLYTHGKMLAYDHTIDAASTMGENAHFFAEGVATYRQPPLDKVNAYIAMNGLHDDNPVEVARGRCRTGGVERILGRHNPEVPADDLRISPRPSAADQVEPRSPVL